MGSRHGRPGRSSRPGGRGRSGPPLGSNYSRRVTEPAAALVIAIDGPSGSGKSSVSRAVATSLGLAYLDTGAMYRALTWWCRHEGLDLDDIAAVAEAARRLPLTMGTDPAAPSVQVGTESVDAAIRLTEISESVSKVATNLEVRAELLQRQRDIIADCSAAVGGVVAEGRDITTVVAPDADVRILLVASEEARLPAGPGSCTARPTTRRSTPPATRSSAATATTPRCRSSCRPHPVSTRSTPPTWTSSSRCRRCSTWSPSGPGACGPEPAGARRPRGRTRHHRKCETMDVDPAPPPPAEGPLP